MANEVKSLAQLTASAAEDIASRIDLVQFGTNDAVNSTKEISNIIDDVAEITDIIASAGEEQRAVTYEIAKSASVVSDDVAAVTESVTGVTQASARSYSNAIQVLWVSETLDLPMQKLNTVMTALLQRIRAA